MQTGDGFTAPRQERATQQPTACMRPCDDLPTRVTPRALVQPLIGAGYRAQPPTQGAPRDVPTTYLVTNDSDSKPERAL